MAISLSEIKKVLILGSGTLGLRIGLQAALSGFYVTIYDINESAIESARKTQASILKWLISKEIINAEESNEALKKISFTINAVSAAKDADFVSESVIEDLGVKKKVWSQFSTLCPAHTVFTTNTSYLRPSGFSCK